VKRLRDYWVGRDVTLLWAGQVLSQAGDSVYMIALMWLMLDLTGSKALTGLAAMSAYLPTLFIGLVAGAAADRFNRRIMMAVADVVRALLVLCVPLLHRLGRLEGGSGALALGIITFAIACVSTFFNPARDAYIPDITPKGRLSLANGLIQSSWQLAMFVGPSLAGLLLPFTGLVAFFHFDAAMFAVSAVFVMLLPAAAGRVARPAGAGRWPAGRRILEGVRHAWSDRRIRGLVLVTAAYNIFLMGLPYVATPVYVREVLDNRPETYAWLQAVYAAGMLPGIALAHVLSKRIRPGRLMLYGIVLDGLTFMPFYFIETKVPALVMMAVHSMVIPLIMVPRVTLVQSLVTREMQGRVFSILAVFVTGFSALSSGLVGLSAEFVSVDVIFLVFGGLSALVGVLGFLDRHLAAAG